MLVGRRRRRMVVPGPVLVGVRGRRRRVVSMLVGRRRRRVVVSGAVLMGVRRRRRRVMVAGAVLVGVRGRRRRVVVPGTVLGRGRVVPVLMMRRGRRVLMSTVGVPEGTHLLVHGQRAAPATGGVGRRGGGGVGRRPGVGRGLLDRVLGRVSGGPGPCRSRTPPVVMMVAFVRWRWSRSVAGQNPDVGHDGCGRPKGW